ncbi:MAG TPA: CAP domain-containing protein [Mycobacteriales bacterium]|jgi:hypothetical protein|nr:CAP domain-containing protein [Mycobacteriales bacterium]
MLLRKVAALVIAPAVVAGIAFTAVSASAGSDANAAAFVAKTNSERTSRGLRAYTVASDLTAVALRHSQEMAAKQSLYHNPNLGSEVSGWQVVGENVGDGGTVDSIHTAFMKSPAHRANILATDYTEVGIGTVTDANGRLWVTEVFRLPYRTPTVAAPRTTHASRSATRPVTRRPVSRPVAKPVAKPAALRRAAVVAPVRPDASAFVTALAPVTDPLSQAVGYADTMGAFTR